MKARCDTRSIFNKTNVTNTIRHGEYEFKVNLEPDDGGWFVYVPALQHLGGATWGETEDEAIKNIKEALALVVESLLEDDLRRLKLIR